LAEITKSSRHRKIIGDFGENLICNWLSRSGFEVTLVDHTGIDIIAYNLSTRQRLGITVKSRTRNIGAEEKSVNIFSYRKGKDDRQKLLDSCRVFACQPWVAVYVETSESADVYWKMRKRNKELYEKDPGVKHIRIEFRTTNWSWKNC